MWPRIGDYSDSIFANKLKYAPVVMIYRGIGTEYKSKLVVCHVKICIFWIDSKMVQYKLFNFVFLNSRF
jgi:hypothetical protein